jgi:hypothetical protein
LEVCAAMHYDADDIVDISGLCIALGGKDKPLNPATVYRNIKAGLISPPFHPTPNISRWSKSRELARAIARQVGETTDDELEA